MSKREEYYKVKTCYERAKSHGDKVREEYFKEELKKMLDSMTVEEWLTL